MPCEIGRCATSAPPGRFIAGIKNVTLNLHTARGRAILLDLVTTAVNFIPSMLEEQRTGPAEMHARQPNLVIRQVSGRGQTGIYRHKPNFGSPIEAISPFATNNGYGNRLQMLPPHALIDNIIGLYGAFTLTMATRFREVSATHCTKPVCDAEDDLYAALLASIHATAERLFHAIGKSKLIYDPRSAPILTKSPTTTNRTQSLLISWAPTDRTNYGRYLTRPMLTSGRCRRFAIVRAS